MKKIHTVIYGEYKIPYYKWCYGKFILVGYVEKD